MFLHCYYLLKVSLYKAISALHCTPLHCSYQQLLLLVIWSLSTVTLLNSLQCNNFNLPRLYLICLSILVTTDEVCPRTLQAKGWWITVHLDGGKRTLLTETSSEGLRLHHPRLFDHHYPQCTHHNDSFFPLGELCEYIACYWRRCRRCPRTAPWRGCRGRHRKRQQSWWETEPNSPLGLQQAYEGR